MPNAAAFVSKPRNLPGYWT